MTDFFTLLDEPRRPWLEPEALKQKFLALSASSHPDHAHRGGAGEKVEATQRYAQLNAAYNCLRDPKPRLAHFLQLELGEKPRDLQTIPDDLANLFLEVAQLCRKADTLLGEKARVTSPLLRVQWFERGQDFAQELDIRLSRLAASREAVLDRLRAMDAAWDAAQADATARAEALRQLQDIHRLLGFFARWMEQLQERRLQFTV